MAMPHPALFIYVTEKICCPISKGMIFNQVHDVEKQVSLLSHNSEVDVSMGIVILPLNLVLSGGMNDRDPRGADVVDLNLVACVGPELGL